MNAEADTTKPPRRMLQPTKDRLRERIAYLESQVDALTQERVLLRLDLVLARRLLWRRCMDYLRGVKG
jgi:hypothetical protein